MKSNPAATTCCAAAANPVTISAILTVVAACVGSVAPGTRSLDGVIGCRPMPPVVAFPPAWVIWMPVTVPHAFTASAKRCSSGIRPSSQIPSCCALARSSCRNASVFNNHHPNPSARTAHVVLNVSVCNLTTLRSHVVCHGGQDDAIVECMSFNCREEEPFVCRSHRSRERFFDQSPS